MSFVDIILCWFKELINACILFYWIGPLSNLIFFSALFNLFFHFLELFVFYDSCLIYLKSFLCRLFAPLMFFTKIGCLNLHSFAFFFCYSFFLCLLPRIKSRLLRISDAFSNFILLLQQFNQLVRRHAARFCICATPQFFEF